jgi:hypothetical protein
VEPQRCCHTEVEQIQSMWPFYSRHVLGTTCFSQNFVETESDHEIFSLYTRKLVNANMQSNSRNLWNKAAALRINYTSGWEKCLRPALTVSRNVFLHVVGSWLQLLAETTVVNRRENNAANIIWDGWDKLDTQTDSTNSILKRFLHLLQTPTSFPAEQHFSGVVCNLHIICVQNGRTAGKLFGSLTVCVEN